MRKRSESGASLLTSMVGAVVVLAAVLASTQILVGLQRRSVVHAIALDAALDVARSGMAAQSSAEGSIGRALGRDTAIVWNNDSTDIELQVTSQQPHPLFLRGPLATFATARVVVRVRREKLVDD
jgi:hypothetical protein